MDKDYSFDGVKLSSLAYNSGLINGRGRFRDNQAPLSIFKVEKGNKFRFHIVGALSEYAYRISIDQHKLSEIESDGFLIEPIEVESLLLIGGESYVIEVAANQPVDSYWIRAETLKDGEGPYVRKSGRPKGIILAVLQYQGSNSELEPTSVRNTCTENEPCYVFNCFWEKFPEDLYPHTKCITMQQAGFFDSK